MFHYAESFPHFFFFVSDLLNREDSFGSQFDRANPKPDIVSGDFSQELRDTLDPHKCEHYKASLQNSIEDKSVYRSKMFETAVSVIVALSVTLTLAVIGKQLFLESRPLK